MIRAKAAREGGLRCSGLFDGRVFAGIGDPASNNEHNVVQRDAPPSPARPRERGVSMFWRAVFATSVAALLIAPPPVYAHESWLRPVEGPVSLAFHARYEGPRGSCVHGGTDLLAEEGAAVRSCTDGEVVFSGTVPAGPGATCVAVTVLTEDGLRVSYMPLSRAEVHDGQRITAGGALGRLAAAGDPSSPVTHLHLSVRRGDERVDPADLLDAVAATSSKASASSGSGAAGRSSDAAAAAVAGASRVRVTGGALVSPGSAATVPHRGQAVTPVRFPHLEPFTKLPGLAAIPSVSSVPQLSLRTAMSDTERHVGVLSTLLSWLAIGACASGVVSVLYRKIRVQPVVAGATHTA